MIRVQTMWQTFVAIVGVTAIALSPTAASAQDNGKRQQGRGRLRSGRPSGGLGSIACRSA